MFLFVNSTMVTTLLLASFISSPFGCFIPFWMVIHYSCNFILNHYFAYSLKLIKLNSNNSYFHGLAQGPFIKHLNTFIGKHMHNKFSTHFPSKASHSISFQAINNSLSHNSFINLSYIDIMKHGKGTHTIYLCSTQAMSLHLKI